MMEGSTWKIIGAMVQLLLLISMISCSPARQQQETEGQHSIFRRSVNQEETSDTVPSSPTPLHYKLQFTPNFEAATFQGRVQITFTSTVETETVTLHADKELVITQMKLYVVDSNDLQSVDIVGKRRDDDNEWEVITLAKKLNIGVNYELTLDFNGQHLTEKTEGFVMRSYKCPITNETRWFAGTQMPNRKARSVFPCFDDPMFKTPFEVSVARKEGYNTLANTLLRASEPDPDDATLVWDHFVATPPISTFSVGLIVSKSVSVTPSENLNNNGNLRVFGRPGTEIHLETTANLAQKMVTKIESYLGMPLPFSKLDIVVVPSDTSARLFEYAGVLLFRESELADKQAEYNLGIQLARQWFVHMTSPVSWDAVVDAPALGTFVDIASGAFVPPWVVETGWPKLYYFTDEVVVWPEHSSKTAMGMRILEMINYTISEESFKEGLHNLLEERKYKSYTIDDLLAVLDSVASNKGTDLSASQIVKQWFKNRLVPVVTITRNYEAGTANIKQNAFSTNCPHDMSQYINFTWTIPLMYFTEGNQEVSSQSPVTWMNDKEMTVTDMPEADKFIVVNPKGIGIYLVNYDERNWAMIAQYLAEDPTRMTVATRYNLLHNAWNLGLGGELDFNSVLDMTLFLPKERTWSVWNNYNRMYGYLSAHLDGTQAGKKFKEYTTLLTTNLMESLREPTLEQNEEIIKIRDSAKDMLAELTNITYEEKAGTYKQWIEDMDPSEDISGDNRIVLCAIIRWGSNEEWDLSFNKLFNSTSTDNPSWRQNFGTCIAQCSKQDEQFQRIFKAIFLENADLFTDNYKDTLMFVVGHVYGGMKNMLTFLSENWNAVKHSLESKPRLWKELVGAATEYFKTQEDLDKVMALYEARKEEFGVAKEVIQRSIMKVTKEIEWSNRNHPVIEAWLDHKLAEMRN